MKRAIPLYIINWRCLLATIFFLFVYNAIVRAQSQDQVVHLRSGDVHPTANAHHWLDSFAAAPFKEPVQVLMHFSTTPTLSQKEILKQNGIELTEYIPSNTFTAIIHQPVGSAVLNGIPIVGITMPRPEWKGDKLLWTEADRQKGAIEVLVSFYSGTGDAAIRKFVAASGGQVKPSGKEKLGAYNIIISSNRLRSLAAWYGVKCISPVREMTPLDYQNRAAMMANIAANPPAYGGNSLYGDSITIGIGDESSGIYHADVKDRITNFNPATNLHHGEHVTGIVGSAGNVDPMALGICPHANLINCLYDFILPISPTLYTDYNMTITNNSYAVIVGDCGYAGTYDGYAQLLDTLAIQAPQITNVFASANDGDLTCTPYLPGFATVAGGYQPAKNNIVVGSMTDFYVQRYDESRGPVKDGRLKPDMIAIGWVVYSCINYDGYEWAAGTSMAAPGVAGGLGLLTQRYKQLNGGNVPRADVLKALTLNGGLDLGNPGPDFSYGFGGLDLYRSLDMLNNNHYVTGAVNTGDSQTVVINVPANIAQAKVMLVWTDPPGSAYASKELVNDLDLSVIDPSAIIHLPLVLNSNPDSVNNNATEQPDHLNNVEQVTINNPTAGNYVIKVKGYDVPYPAQTFAVAYDFIPQGIHLTYPVGGESYDNTDSFRVYWEGVPDGNSCTVQFSTDGGANWITFNSNVPSGVWHYDTVLNGINSAQCMVRVTRNGTSDVSTSGQFLINTQPTVILDTNQCPGYINIHWNKVPLATAYLMMNKNGPYMTVVDSVIDTFYSFTNMSQTENNYVAICPIINGQRGYRSVSAIVIANTGNCANPVSNGDLMMQRLLSPASGRWYTSSQLGSNDTLGLLIRNLYQSPCDSYLVSWQVNGGGWTSTTFSHTIPANSWEEVQIPGFNFSDTGVYQIQAAITNLKITDPVPQNDSINFTIQNIANNALNLATPFFEGFEETGAETVTDDSIGISPSGRWDFLTRDSFGRFRTYIMDGFAITGNRAASMDNSRVVPSGTNNQLVGTFNLSNYDTAASEIRLDFDYVIYGIPYSIAGNLLESRPNDQAPWAPLFNYNVNAYPGTVNHVQSISITDAMRAAGSNFSTSTQLSFGQNDTSLICTNNYGNGITIDNISMYTVNNDAALTAIMSPQPTNCGLTGSIPLTVQVHNGVNYTLYNVHLFYSIDSGTVQTGVLDSITAKATINYTFPENMPLSAALNHNLNVWLSAAGDTYHENDSILQYQFKNSPIISSFPYLENFESGSGFYYSEGVNDCWQYGTPASPIINKAASGTHAWKTNLTGNYNNLEQSYLYGPCFDFSLIRNPMLSFSAALDIENCGATLCDQAYIEYSFDNLTWTKLGGFGQGTNWYDSTFDIWNTEGFTRWHVASIPLPVPPAGSLLHLRFAMVTDEGGTYEGFAIDDIHIYDLSYPICTANSPVADSGQLNGYYPVSDTINNSIFAAVNPGGQNLGFSPAVLYPHTLLYNTAANQYTFPRNIALRPRNTVTDSITLQLFITDSEIVQTITDTTCPACTKFPDAYSLGVTQYFNNNDPACENGTLVDDTGGVFRFIHGYPTLQWIPYDQGYYALFKTTPLGEFWFNNGGPSGTVPAGLSYLDFSAFRTANRVSLGWYTPIDTAIATYTLLRSADSITFYSISDTNSAHLNPGSYSHTDATAAAGNTYYYQLAWTMTTGDSTYYSPIRKVDPSDSESAMIVFSATMSNSQNVNLNWTSYIDGITDHYLLTREIVNGSSGFIMSQATEILERSAVHNYGQQYYYTDAPNVTGDGDHIVYYQLTAVLVDGSQLALTPRSVKWIEQNTLANLYPNPATTGVINLQWYANSGTTMDVRITDEYGRSIFSGAMVATQWVNTSAIDLGYHPAGTYFAYITIAGTKKVVKFTIE